MSETKFTPRAGLPTQPGIYLIRCTVTERTYVGASKTSVRARTSAHRRQLTAGTHSNKGMQSDWLAHGETSFTFEVAELVQDAGELQAAENRHMEAHAANLYNRVSSAMRRVPGTERDLSVYKAFHSFRGALYARPLKEIDAHLLTTLHADLSRQIADISTELERRAH